MDGRSGGFAKVQMSLLFCLVLRHESVSLRPHNSGSKSPPGLFQPDIVITGQHSNVLQDWNADNMTDKGKKKKGVLLCLSSEGLLTCVHIFTRRGNDPWQNDQLVNQTWQQPVDKMWAYWLHSNQRKNVWSFKSVINLFIFAAVVKTFFFFF